MATELLDILRLHLNDADVLDSVIVDEAIPVQARFETVGDLKLAAKLYMKKRTLCERLFGPIEGLEVLPNLCNMSYIFADAGDGFNPDLGRWDVQHVRTFASMFASNKDFQGIGLQNWNTGAMENAKSMFRPVSEVRCQPRRVGRFEPLGR